MALTDLALKNAKPKTKPYKLADGEGLYLFVNPNGSRLWRMDYRFAGKRRTSSFGKYPKVTLADARKARDAVKDRLREGVDPAVEKKARQRRAEAQGKTFRQVAEEWLANRRPGLGEKYAAFVESRLKDHIYPSLGNRPIREIDPPLVLETIRRIEAKGKVELPRRMLRTCGQIFRYAVATSEAERDMAAGLVDALKSRPRVRHNPQVPKEALGAFLGALGGYDGAERTRLGVGLILLTMVRTDEARFAAWAEFERLDSEAPLWRIPAQRMKMKREHLVPLAPQAVEILRRLKELAYDNPMLFAAPTRSGVVSENTFLFALYRMGYHSRATIHGLRGTASTILNEKGFNSDWIERQLAHVPEDKVRSAYNAAEYLDGRREMLAWWADYIDRCRQTAELVG
jgi:integrase